jgi:hypothetical protein
MGHRVKTGIGIVAAAVALALLPTLTASASVDKSSTGSNPNSALCKAYRNSVKTDSKSNAASAQAAKAVQAGNWKAAQKAFLTAYGYQAKDVQNLVSTLSNAPSKVKSAMKVLTTYVSAYKSALQKSTSIKQFSKADQALSNNNKTTAAANTLSKYYTGQCGTSGNSTTTSTSSTSAGS